VDIKANTAKQDHWEVDIMAILVKLELTWGTLVSREEGYKLDIQVNQLDTLVNQLDTPISQQVTLVNQPAVIRTNLLHILHNQQDFLLQSMQATLVLGAFHTQPSRPKGCLVCFTHQVLLDLQLAKVDTNNTMQANHPILLPVQHSHPRHQRLPYILH